MIKFKNALIRLGIFTLAVTKCLSTEIETTLKLGEGTKKEPLSKESEFLINSKSLDEIYYTLDDKKELKLSKEALCAIENICNNEISEVYEYYNEEYVNLLDINELNATDTYANFEDIEIINHQYETYYDEEKDSIDWDSLAHKIYLNGLNSPQNDALKETYTLSLKEIKQKLKRMEYFLKVIKQDYPNYDVGELACNLENASFLKGKVKDKDEKIVARTSHYSITYYINKNLENKLKGKQEAIDYHEWFHFFINSCQDIIEIKNIVGLFDGVYIHSTFYPKYYDNNKLDELAVLRYRYDFLQEIYAELYSNDVANSEQFSYLNYDEILNMLQIALGVDENYQIDSILRDLIYKDPITFIKHFPVYGRDKTNYFLNNLRMLKSFDILLLGQDRQSWYYEYVEKNDLNDEEAIINLKLMSFSQLSKIFFHNLIILNEIYEEELSLQDNYYLMRLFEEMIYRSSSAIDNIYKYKIGSVDDSSYKLEKEDFIIYLSKKYNLQKQNIINEYKESNCIEFIKIDYELPEFFEDKKDYYNELMKFLPFSSTSTPYNLTLRKVK